MSNSSQVAAYIGLDWEDEAVSQRRQKRSQRCRTAGPLPAAEPPCG